MKNIKRLLSEICIILMMIVLTACGNQIPDMTEEQNAMVVEYAAKTLLQHSGNYHSKLVDTSAPKEETESEEDNSKADDVVEQPGVEGENPDDNSNQPDVHEEQSAEMTDITDPESAESGETTGSGLEESNMTIAQVLGLSGFEVNYTGYQLCDSYPGEEAKPEDLFFAMNASNGSKLLVLNIEVTNMTTETLLLDTISIDAKYGVILNEEHKQNTLVTMLADDFSAISKEIAAGETISSVVVAEITDEIAGGLQSVGLEVKAGEQKTILIK